MDLCYFISKLEKQQNKNQKVRVTYYYLINLFLRGLLFVVLMYFLLQKVYTSHFNDKKKNKNIIKYTFNKQIYYAITNT